MTDPISAVDVIRLFETLSNRIDRLSEKMDRIADDIAATRATSTLSVQKMISLDSEFHEFASDMLVYRQSRNQAELNEMETQLQVIQKKMELAKSTSGSTQEKIDKAIDTAFKKKGIDWLGMWKEKVLPAIVTTAAVALMLALMSPLIRDWIVPALLSAFGK